MLIEKRYLGIDIGGTKCAVVLGDENCKVLDRTAIVSGAELPPGQLINAFCNAIDGCLSKHRLEADDIEAIGISCGGPLDSVEGVINRPPNLPLWDNIHIVSLLRERYKIPVFLQNDANACALAEWQFGAGRGCRNMVFLTFGTGLGAGLILDGRLYSGTNDMAGEVGHIRLAEEGPVGYGKAGSFEGFCSGGGIQQLGIAAMQKGVTGEEQPTAKDIALAAEKGDETALSILHTSAVYLGKGLSILIDILNPQRIIIGSVYARNEAFFKETAMEIISKEALPYSADVCEILPAQLGNSIGDIACLSVGVSALKEGENK